MDNYPPGTWSGDPRAPWNRASDAEDRWCGDCKWFLADEIVCVCTRGSQPLFDEVDPNDEACEFYEEVEDE
jgi:hypothetical protein